MEIGNEVSVNNPLISIIVPVYNIVEYLPDCLDSILAQSYQNLEIILVDDGSSDGSDKVIDEYKERYPNKFVVIHQKNIGVSQARENGIKQATGEWIGFVDGDDFVEPEMFERLIGNAIKYQADISHCGYQTIVNGGERVHKFYGTGCLVEQDNLTGLKNLLEGSLVEPSLWNKVFHKTLFHSLLHEDKLDHSLKINEDLLMNYYLFKKANKSVFEDICCYHYMARTTSATRSEFKDYKLLDPLKVRTFILNDVPDELKEIAWAKYLQCCMGVYSSFYNRPLYKEKCKEIKKILKDNKNKWSLMGKKEKLKCQMIMTCPWLYRLVYRIYEKFFQHKVYE